MNKNHEQFDALEKKVSGALGKSLKVLYSPEVTMSGAVDRAVLDAARRRLARPGRRLRLVWRSAAAVAAAVLLAVVLTSPWDHKTQAPPMAALPADIDGDGRVDILDAYKLARRVEAAGETEAAWDLNADGRVDRADVDLVALAAVRLDGKGA